MRADERPVLDRLADGLGRTDGFDFVQDMAAPPEVFFDRG
ncbi:MAG: hypothetical protein RLZZ322_984, partial [Verrucomicrobiota bacterium]